MGPAPEDMIPQFITNWLGSYIDADSAPEMLMSPGVVPEEHTREPSRS